MAGWGAARRTRQGGLVGVRQTEEGAEEQATTKADVSFCLWHPGLRICLRLNLPAGFSRGEWVVIDLGHHLALYTFVVRSLRGLCTVEHRQRFEEQTG